MTKKPSTGLLGPCSVSGFRNHWFPSSGTEARELARPLGNSVDRRGASSRPIATEPSCRDAGVRTTRRRKASAFLRRVEFHLGFT